MLLLFIVAIFSGAGLLFLVQPMIAKQLLPMLGGSPSVWNTCMVFFQFALLGGYIYAHLLAKLRSAKTQLVVHIVVMVAALATLPIGLGDAPGPATGESPNAWLLLRLATSVGGPFFVLASASPLIQRWFSATRHRWAADPYFLYAASNAGSMLALLAYPLVLEPDLTLRGQTESWSWGFGGFALLALACAVVAVRGDRHPGAGSVFGPDAPTISWKARLHWIALAFVPSSLMLGVTQHITTDVATTPILWVGPLAIYLLTFIIAFAGWGRRIANACDLLLPFVVFAVGALLIAGVRKPIWSQVWIHLAGLLVLGTAIHGRLSADRPNAGRLTEFYLLLSVGGALGGVFNALVAPIVFDWVAEYPITLALACFLRGSTVRTHAENTTRSWVPFAWAGAAAALVATLYVFRWDIRNAITLPETLFGFPAGELFVGLLPAFGCLVFVRQKRAFAIAIVTLFVAPRFDGRGANIHTERTFFGILRVEEQLDGKEGKWHFLWHGSTVHGTQYQTKPWSMDPTRYYTRSGPAGDIMRVLGGRPGPKHVAQIGLGIGTLAAYGKPDWRMTYYEIDPEVVKIAQNPAFFSYCTDSAAQLDFVIGDARLRISETRDRYDAIILDAFSSDAIPVHLITKNAVELYLQRLQPGGILAFHITNLHLDLTPVLANIARDLGLVAAVRYDGMTEGLAGQDKQYSAWAVLARRSEALGAIAPDANWTWLQADPSRKTWTDDYSHVLGVLR